MNLDASFSDGRIAHIDETVGAALDRVLDIAAKTAVRDDQKLRRR